MPLEGYGLLPISELANNDLIEQFNSSSQNLNRFLFNDAKTFHQGSIGLTTCVLHNDVEDKIIAYYTLSNSGITLTSSEFQELAINTQYELKTIPSVLVGKFAVAQEFAGCGNGRNILSLLMSSVVDQHKISAARVVVVDAVLDSVQFYEKCGFVHSLSAEKRLRINSPIQLNCIKIYCHFKSAFDGHLRPKQRILLINWGNFGGNINI